MRAARRRNDGERRAARHYLLRGYRVLARNEWVGRYELDLVVRRGRSLVFVEVKGKSGEGYGDPLEMVDAEKRRRVAAAAAGWLAARPGLARLDVRFEAVAVRRGRVQRVPLA